MAFRPTARSPYRIAPGRSRSLRGPGCDTESAEQFPFPATEIRLIAISESVLSDSRDLRRHFRVVSATDRQGLVAWPHEKRKRSLFASF